MTEKTIKALEIVRDNPGLSARIFAKLMWPDSNMHHKVSNTGYGATHRKAGWLCGGSYLGKLCKKGLVRQHPYTEFYITTAGKDVLSGGKL